MRRMPVLLLAVTALAALGCSDGGSSSIVDSLPDDGENGGTPGNGSGFDPFVDNGIFLSVLPPGQSDSNTGMGNEANFMDQLPMYENLAFTQPGQLQDENDLMPAFFKDEAFLPESAFASLTTVTDGNRSARIGRDEFGVPHIFGDTRADVMFGTGYASAMDRLFLIDVLRHVGRGRLSDFVGASAGNYAMDRDLGLVAGYDEGEIQAQIDQLSVRFDATGDQIIQDSADYAAGLNAYVADLPAVEPIPIEYTAILQPQGPVPFTPRDVLAVATLVQATFAVGGGNEHRQVQLLNTLFNETDGNATAACELWRDFRHFDDPEKSITTARTFQTQSPSDVDETACPFDPGFASRFPGAVLFDDGSLQTIDILEIEDCFVPFVDCPDYLGDVANDSPDGVNFQAQPPPPTLDSTSGGPAPQLDFSKLGGLATSEIDFEASHLGRALALLSRESAPASTLARPLPYKDAGAEPGQMLAQLELSHARQRVEALVDGVIASLTSGSFPAAMSNAILVNGNQTTSGDPIAVFGPQTGYFVPQLLLEFSQQGGDLHTRGMSFAGLPYAVIGRGIDHAWSATSAGDDIIDIRVLRLCEPGGGAPTRNSRGYLYNGVCTPMFERMDNWTAEYNAASPPPTPPTTLVGQAVTRTILRAPDYGPVFATATVGGQPVALAIQRSTFFGEVDSAVPFIATGRNQMVDPQSFFEVFNTLTGTFNWFYVDQDNIAYFNSGLLPIRASGIHPDLPAWGDGNFDWAQTRTGEINPNFSFDNFLPLSAHPREANPARGFFANWNNAQAPGFWANDGQVDYGPVHRSEKLERRMIAFRDDPANPQHTVGSMVEIMIDAGTTDLRGQEIVRQALQILGDVGGESQIIQDTVALLDTWVDNGTRGLGAMRRDRDGPGLNTAALEYQDRPAIVFMDLWWDNLIETVLPQITAVEPNMVGGRHDLPNDIGSAFQGGYYGYMRRVFDMVLGQSPAPYRRLACAGTGTPGDCRQAILDSMQATIAALGNDMAQWDGTDNANGSNPGDIREVDDAISHSAVGLATVPDIHWQNRPTFQQVIQISQERAP